MALLGCSVTTTDQVEVLPLLMKNVERNTSWISQANPDSASFGSIEVAELVWGNMDHIKAVDPPFDFIIGTDVIYAEHLLEPLLQTILALSGPRTTILLGYEIRSTTVHERMMDIWKSNFEVKTIPRTKMDIKHQHPSIQLFMLEMKDQVKSTININDANQISEALHDDDDNQCWEAVEEGNKLNKVTDGKITELESGNADDREIRRC